MNVGSLFSGVGGLDLGLERAGMSVLWQCEIDPWRRGILDFHWPDVPCYADALDLPLAGLAPVDLVCGGFPCQDVSIAGRRAGLDGARSSLFFAFAAAADALRPRWLLLENVEGLLSSHGGRDFGTVLGTLAELGYGLAWRVLDARYFGVPQRRRRVFVVGHLGGEPGPAIRALIEGGGGHPAAGDEAGQDAAGAAGGSTSHALSRGRRLDGTVEDFVVSPTLQAHEGKAGGGYSPEMPMVVEDDPTFGQDVANPLYTNAQGGVRTSDVEGATYVQAFVKTQGAHHDADDEHWDEADVSRTLTGFEGGPSRASALVAYSVQPVSADVERDTLTARRTEIAEALTAAGVHRRSERGTLVAAVSENQRNELRETAYAPQLTRGGGKPGTGYPAIRNGAMVRRLTPLEQERLMGWPDYWTAPPGVRAPSSRRSAACGDGVVAPVAEWIGRRILLEDEA